MGRASARVTRRSGSSFYYAFLLLPAAKRRAIYALYSFCRVLDDCVDERDGGGEAGLARWLEEVHRCYAGRPTTELGKDLAEALFQFPIPRGCFEELVAGCRMDLAACRYRTYDDLRLYCRRVASSVGLASIEIFGYEDARTREYAVELGLALQLTNILRDVAQDAGRDRLYLPLEDLARFGVGEAELVAHARDPRHPRPARLSELLAFEADRARSHYAAAARLLPAPDRRSMAAAEIMGAIYRAVLESWAGRGFPVAGPRVRLGTLRKLWIAGRTLLRVRLGA
jgi:phytoene synthase